jgi:hypothetical protein
MDKKRIGLVVILIFLWTATTRPQEIAVPVSVQYPLFLRILTFDRNLEARVGDEIVIAIVYQEKFKRSLNVKDELVRVMDESPIKKIEDIPIRYVPIDIRDKTDLAKVVSKNKADILYITPLRTIQTETITAVSRDKKITTLTGVPDYVESGLAVGIGIKGEKPLIIVNLKGAKAEGVNFDSELLKLAKIVE